MSCVLRFMCPFQPRARDERVDLIRLVPSSGATAHDGSEATKSRLIIDPEYRHLQIKLSSGNQIISRI